MFDTKLNLALASGTFSENNGQLTIETELNGFNNFFLVFYIILIIFYSIFITVILISGFPAGFMGLPFILIHAGFMGAIPYLIMRRSLKRMKYDLEREFFFLTK